MGPIQMQRLLKGGGRSLKLRFAALAIVAAVVVPAVALAQFVHYFAANPLLGTFEIPPVNTQAHGVATLQLSSDLQTMHYEVRVANIRNVNQGHIHIVPPGESADTSNGPVAVWLFPVGATTPGPPGSGPFDGVIATGTFTAANFVGPLSGLAMSDLLHAILEGRAYVNFHTDDGVPPPNTGPGDFPGGEIRNTVREVPGQGSNGLGGHGSHGVVNNGLVNKAKR